MLCLPPVQRTHISLEPSKNKKISSKKGRGSRSNRDPEKEKKKKTLRVSAKYADLDTSAKEAKSIQNFHQPTFLSTPEEQKKSGGKKREFGDNSIIPICATFSTKISFIYFQIKEGKVQKTHEEEKVVFTKKERKREDLDEWGGTSKKEKNLKDALVPLSRTQHHMVWLETLAGNIPKAVLY